MSVPVFSVALAAVVAGVVLAERVLPARVLPEAAFPGVPAADHQSPDMRCEPRNNHGHGPIDQPIYPGSRAGQCAEDASSGHDQRSDDQLPV